LRRPKGLIKEKINVLNTSELKIETLIFEEVDQEQIKIAGKTFKCRVFKATKPKGESKPIGWPRMTLELFV
jgi:hypothetical protein